MKNKGFTLIEILGVITLLALLSTIIILSVNKSLKNSKETLSEIQIEEIKSAAAMWRTDNIELIPENGFYTMSLSDLQGKGYIKENIIDAKTNENIDNDLLIEIGMKDIQLNDVLIKNGYKKLEYIESTGTQYINTGVIANQDTGFDIIFLTKNLISRNPSEYGSVFGAREASKKRELQLTTFSNISAEVGTIRFGINSYNAGLGDITEIKHITLMQKSYRNNNDFSINVEGEFTTPKSLTVFALNNNDSVIQYGKLRLYSFKLYDGNTIIRNFIPCLRKSDNKPGLYDTVNNQFYTNSGTDEFLYKLPNESPYDRLYTKLDYIESTGTQYIDTGYYWQHENIEIDFDGTVITNSSNQALFGNEEYKESSGLLRNFSGVAHGSNGNYGIYIGDGNKGTILTTIGTRFNLKIKTTSDKNLKVYKDDNLSLNLTYTGTVMTKQNSYNPTASKVGNIFLFANHNTLRSETPETAIQNIGRMKLYSFKMYDNDVLVRNFIPCKRNSDNEIGLYDEVNDVFYTNSGTGTFSYGVIN